MTELLEQMKLLNEDHTPDGYPAVKMSEINELIEIIEKKSDQLEKANEDYKTLFSAFESCQDELKESNERESVLSCQLDSHMERVAELEKENKRESMELRSRLGSALGRNSEYNSAIENMQQKLAKSNERVAELEAELDFIDSKIIDLQHQVGTLEFNRVTSKDLNKFALERKIEALDEVESVYMQAAETSEPISFREAFDAVEEQLRKEQE